MAEKHLPGQTHQDIKASAPPQKQYASTIARRWNESIDVQYTDLICLALCLITGLCDSSAYNAWSCFLAMQTGS